MQHDHTFGEAMFGELSVHAHHVDRSCEEGAQHGIRKDLPPVFRILQIVFLDMHPNPLHNLWQKRPLDVISDVQMTPWLLPS